MTPTLISPKVYPHGWRCQCLLPLVLIQVVVSCNSLEMLSRHGVRSKVVVIMIKAIKVVNKWFTITSMIILGAVVIKLVDSKGFPVVKDFFVTSMTTHPNNVRVKGTMEKTRNCRPLGVSAFYRTPGNLPTATPLTFLDAEVDSRPSIEQSWGPWQVDVPVESRGKITLYVNHRCHILWDTSTRLTVFAFDTRG